MQTRTLAILHPGAMGSEVGACLRERGHRVLWASEGRSAATVKRAQAAGLEDAGTLDRLAAQAEIIFSICPPHGAVELARAVAATGYRGVFVDANAVSVDTVLEIEAIVTQAGMRFVDGGIIGTAPRKAGNARIYFSGAQAADVAALLAGSTLGAIALDGPAGQASALKVCYAAWSKGSTALLAGIRALARHGGVEDALMAEWGVSAPYAASRSEDAAKKAEKAWRWVGEMQEIAASFEKAGLPTGFHDAAATIYERLDAYKGYDAPPPASEVIDKLLGR
jgi:3-hydroxyisobutyrate dehydrogenase-like beta-hydroxyacid dehydrogenase